MSKRTSGIYLPALALLCLSGLRADEGVWLPNQFPSEAVQQKYGFRPSTEFLKHLQTSAVRFNNGGTGSFVSSEFSRTIMRPTRCRILVDGRLAEPTEFSLVVCSVFKDVGLGIKVTYRAGNAENKIALVTSSLPASKLGPQFWRVLSGRALRDPQGIDCLAREWAIMFDDRGPLIIDGDRFNVRCATIRQGPVWSVLCPN